MTKWRVDDAEPWRHNRVLVTGGGGFLGRAVVAALRARGAAEILTPRRHEYDLRDGLAIQRFLADSSRPGNGGHEPVFSPLQLEGFALVDDAGTFRDPARAEEAHGLDYGCGMFELSRAA